MFIITNIVNSALAIIFAFLAITVPDLAGFNDTRLAICASVSIMWMLGSIIATINVSNRISYLISMKRHAVEKVQAEQRAYDKKIKTVYDMLSRLTETTPTILSAAEDGILVRMFHSLDSALDQIATAEQDIIDTNQQLDEYKIGQFSFIYHLFYSKYE